LGSAPADSAKNTTNNSYTCNFRILRQPFQIDFTATRSCGDHLRRFVVPVPKALDFRQNRAPPE
jgi:hypothetical protein